MKINTASLLSGLIQYNFFPAQKKDDGELPPIIKSATLTPAIADQLRNLPSRIEGYDQIEYRATKFNNVSRPLSIPHPLPYSKLCYTISDNWQNFEYITQSHNSLIKPEIHSDGRILVMDYENTHEKIRRHINFTFGKRFYVNTDISNFFPSIYSHSIAWALVGFNYAKTHRNKNLWFNQVDACTREMKRNETNGVPIGPATSNIISEAILARIDQILGKENNSFIRFIDDYTAYFDTYEEAEKFIRRLEEELAKFKLSLNARKTFIGSLPCPSSPEWVVDLTTRLPQKDNVVPSSLIRFLDYAVEKQKTSPDGSVLKYATKAIIRDIDDKSVDLVLKYLLGLSIKFPILISVLNSLFSKVDITAGSPYSNQLLKILDEHTINRRSDAMVWTLYFINRFKMNIPQKTAYAIISSQDCISILMLYGSGQYDDVIIRFCNDLIKQKDGYLLDQYWLLLYQLFFDGKISNPYSCQSDKSVFDILKSNGAVFFLSPSNISASI